MIICAQGKFTFFSNPKTGSTALESALLPHATIALSQNPKLKHIGVNRYEKRVLPFMDEIGLTTDLARVGVIREPIDWVFSWYRYRSRDALKGHQNSTADISFDQFVEGYLRVDPPPYARIGTPSGIFRGRKQAICVEELYPFEAIDALITALEKRLGAKLEVPANVNASPKMDMELSPKNRAALEEKLTADYEAYAMAMLRGL